MKVLAGRPKDVDDVDDVVAVAAAYRHMLDTEYIERTSTTLEAALPQSDLLPLFRLASTKVR